MNEELTAKCSCTLCGNHIEFPLEAAGAQVNCPHCGDLTELTLTAPPAPRADRPSAAQLAGAFEGTIQRTRVPTLYRLGLMLTASVMILLPICYVVLIAAAAFGVWLYATHFSSLLQPTQFGLYFYLMKVVAYFAPLFSGVILVLFMVKPLFARRPHHAQPLAMNPALEPALYAFIARICDLVGAPMPARIDLVCDLNASAGFRRGAASLLENDLVLTIGLPMVAGLNLQQMAGVIAHEFGHFTQGFGMRLSYVIRRIDLWFARVVYQRDAWDVWLEQCGMEATHWTVLLVVNCARLAVGFSRVVLQLLMLLGHGACCFLMRQMEYDADSYEIKIAGSASFESATRRVAELGEALARSYKEMRVTWNLSRRLPEDFPAYLMLQHSKLPPVRVQQMQDRLGLAQTGLFDTHPSCGDRIRRARLAAEPGVFHLDLPASMLFSHFEVVSKQVSFLHYAEDLGIPFNASNLRAVESATTREH